MLPALALAALSCFPSVTQASNVNDNANADADVPSWHQYVRAPPSALVSPQSIRTEQFRGNVSNRKGLLSDQSGGPTVLTRNDESEEKPSFIVDFGQNVVGLLEIEFAGSTSLDGGLPGLKLAFSETMAYLTNTSDYTRSERGSGDDKITPGTDQIAVAHGPSTWLNQQQCQHPDTKQVCSDGLHGFRYVRVTLDALASDSPYTSSLGSVSISSVKLRWSGLLGTPDTFTGWFECSDADLTQWWYDGVYTTDTNTDVFLRNESEPRNAGSPSLEGKRVILDGAKRDRDPYIGDLAVASLTSYLSHDAPEASRNVLEDLARHQRSDGWIPPASINGYTLPLFDYPLWWVVCSVDHVMYTGNTTYAADYWHVLTKTLDGYYPAHTDASNGLLSKNDSSYGDYAFLPRSGPITYYNALYVHALTYASRLAALLDRPSDAARWSARATSVSAALQERNLDRDTGAYFDGGACPEAQDPASICNVHAQDGNGLAALSGAADHAVALGALKYYAKATALDYGNAFYDSDVLQSGFSQRVYAFVSYFELAGRFATSGLAESAYDQLRRMYGWMAGHDPLITQWEGIGAGGLPYEQGTTSMAHGWSSGIVPLMSRYVLGVTPTAPGFAKWQVCPIVSGGGLTWAQGLVPTPSDGGSGGDGCGIKMSWKKSEDDDEAKLEIELATPEGTSGLFCVPFMPGTKNIGNEAVVEVDGEQVGEFVGGDQLVGPVTTAGKAFVVQGGKHRIAIHSPKK